MTDLRIPQSRPVRCYAVLNAHGGAGGTTVAGMLDADEQSDAREVWAGAEIPPNRSVVLVARTTAYGLKAAGGVLSRWHPDVPRPWLVLLRDVPVPIALPVRCRIRILSGHVLGVVHVPYLWPLRSVDAFAEASHPAVDKAARLLRAAVARPPRPVPTSRKARPVDAAVSR